MNAAKPSRSRKVNREQRRRELIAALRELAAAEGPDVTKRQFAKHLGRSEPYVVAYFDSWCDLREAAGLPRKRRVGYSPETLVDTLVETETSYGKPVSRRRFYHLTGISPSICDRVFGSWREFREAAGLKEVATPGVPAKYSRDELLRLMREQIPDLGRQMTRNQFAKAAGVSVFTIDRLGNWGALRKELGLTSRGRAKAKSFAEVMGIPLVDNAHLLVDFSDP